MGKTNRMHDAAAKSEGLRERKRRQTLQRISEVGLEFFIAKGYEATTLDEIAAAAGISRRTFFYYFDSKEDILLAYVGGFADALKALVIENASAGAPLDIVRDAVLKLVAPHRESQMLATARIVRQSETLRARNLRTFQQLEQAVLEGLCELWPKKENRERWRLVAMISMGALRLASDSWNEQDGKRPLAKYVQEVFKRLKAEI
ncbi:MAG: helix-turn-helix domain-containing protein [Hyphomicrobium sp.]|jgi:AcrR family transcriptional regulator